METTLTIEEEYQSATSLVHRKQYGQFFTPAPVADVLARWVAPAHPRRLLDPALGTGVLARAMRRYVPAAHLTGYDVDAHILSWWRKAGEATSADDVQCQDFLRHNWAARYDGIIANPPYLKFHDYDNLPAIQLVEQEAGVKLTGFTNLYALFIIKAISQLAMGGRAAFVVPSEFLNADYGVAVKQFMVAHGSLRHVVVVDFRGSVFADALTTACLLLFEHQPDVGATGIAFSALASPIALDNWVPADASNLVPLAELDPTVKWRRYYQPKGEGEGCSATARYGPLVPFRTVGKVSRGIATGANDYFVFSKSKAQRWGLSLAHSLRPCVARSADVPGSFFTADAFERLSAADRPVFILDLGPSPADEAARAYLVEGETQGISTKHLPAARRPWHRPENRLPSPIWVTVFNRGGLRFVRNETNTLNLTTFHCVYLNLFFQHRLELVMAYLLTDIAKEIFADNRREYGNGLEKFEPNDLNNALMLDLDSLSPDVVPQIEALYRQYRESELAGERNEALREALDEKFRALYLLPKQHRAA